MGRYHKVTVLKLKKKLLKKHKKKQARTYDVEGGEEDYMSPEKQFTMTPAHKVSVIVKKTLKRKWVWIFVLGLIACGICLTYFVKINYTSPIEPVEEPSKAEAESEKSIRIRYKHTNRRLPQCIIIGIRKAGTRALLSFLNVHPDVIVASKEVHFFDENLSEGVDWYRRQMPYTFPGQITVEKTPAYFHLGVAREVYNFNSSIKLLLIVRDPITRTVSDYHQLCLKKQKYNQTCRPFEEHALRRNGQINSSYEPIHRSVYYDYMVKWYSYFPPEQIHIVDGDAFVNDPYGELYKVESFLGIPHKIFRSNFFYNSTKKFFCFQTETKSKCLGESKGRQHPQIPAYLHEKLKSYFFEPNQKFFRLVKHDYGWNDVKTWS